MDNVKNLVVVGIAVAALVLGFLGYTREVPPFGAVGGPDINSPYLNVNGITKFYFSSGLKTATTTVCSFKTPAATTTLITYETAIKFTTSSTTAAQIYIAKGANSNASTTVLGQATLAANGQGVVVATSTPVDGLDEDRTIAPNQYINFSMNGGNGTFSPVGVCQVVLQQI